MSSNVFLNTGLVEELITYGSLFLGAGLRMKRSTLATFSEARKETLLPLFVSETSN